MPSKFRSVLPPSARASERALEQANAEPITSIPNLIRATKSADDCPAALLPWLAWEYSVDTWNTDWNEAEKRAAIKRAQYIHQHRGTKSAVEMSLSDSPFASEIVEWFETQPPGDPYTFGLTVQQDYRPITSLDVQDLKNAVLRAKNLRSWFGIVFKGKSVGTAWVAGAMTASEVVTILPPVQGFITQTEGDLLTEDGGRLLTELRFQQ